MMQSMSEEDIAKLKDDAERHEKEFVQQQTSALVSLLPVV
jgi:hypothetical protein